MPPDGAIGKQSFSTAQGVENEKPSDSWARRFGSRIGRGSRSHLINKDVMPSKARHPYNRPIVAGIGTLAMLGMTVLGLMRWPLVSGTSHSRLGIHIHNRCQHGRDELFFTRLDGKSVSRAHSESLASTLYRRASDE